MSGGPETPETPERLFKVVLPKGHVGAGKSGELIREVRASNAVEAMDKAQAQGGGHKHGIPLSVEPIEDQK
ncbi:hypothetical protein JW766_04270 [Candidatus Dojkabacteria bacterium]|nr:hypothetical protein [Candidatus Dojkabacteria bacterium]